MARPTQTKNLLGSARSKISPRIRVIANATDEVNAVRAQAAANLRVEGGAPLRKPSPLVDREAFEVRKTPKFSTMHELPRRSQVNVFITRHQTEPDTYDEIRDVVRAVGEVALSCRCRGDQMLATVRIADVPKLAEHPAVLGIELAETLRAPRPKTGDAAVTAPSPQLRRVEGEDGEGVLIGIVDVQGFDFAHEDFLDAKGNTRFVEIWDQGGVHRPSPGKPKEPFDYGSKLTATHFAAALREAKKRGLSATAYEPQSSMEPGSHGTHVASIAAGNRGVCPKAEIVAVLLSLGKQDEDRRQSFYDSTRLADAIDYLVRFADGKKKPISINVSLGTNGHAHDGSSAINRWIDSALTVPGRAVCVAAGNAGQEKAESDQDLGFILGRIHTSGRITARGLTADIDWLVMGTGLHDVSENELEIWYSPADRFAVQVKPPGPTSKWTEVIGPGDFIENRQLSDGTFLSIYNELYYPSNGANYIAVYLTPFWSRTAVKGIAAGTWRVRLIGEEVRDGRYDGWIERDDPVRVGGGSNYWAFPSFLAEASNVDRSSISSLACGHNVVAVANLDEHFEKINISSSQGPTRDGRSKPEIAAPGTDIVAAGGFMDPEGKAWIQMTGTSMASPYVAGVVGLMLARNPSLTAAQIVGIIQRTALPLPGADYIWRDDAGYGRIRPSACLDEVAALAKRTDRTKP